MTLAELVSALRAAPGVQSKRDIQLVARHLGAGAANGSPAIAVGDDCAAIPDGAGGHLLLAAEAMWPRLVATEPFFAGYCSVMVNVSDIYAMGGRPLAIVDALWSDGAEGASTLWAGMQDASLRFGVPIVGGHTNLQSPYGALGVAILGRARSLITSFDARPGDALIAAIDLRGAMHPKHPFWNASDAPPARLRGDYEVLPWLAEQGLCRAGKDISMGGLVGSLLMLLESSGVGATVDLDAVPSPTPAPDRLTWLLSFPSFGFVLAVDASAQAQVCDAFHRRDIAAAVIGTVTRDRSVVVKSGAERADLWDFERESLTGFSPGEKQHA